MKIKNLIAIIGMMAAVVTATINADEETPSTGNSGGGGSVGNEEEPCPPLSIPNRLPIGDVTDTQAGAWEKVAFLRMRSWASSAIKLNDK